MLWTLEAHLLHLDLSRNPQSLLDQVREAVTLSTACTVTHESSSAWSPPATAQRKYSAASATTTGVCAAELWPLAQRRTTHRGESSVAWAVARRWWMRAH